MGLESDKDGVSTLALEMVLDGHIRRNADVGEKIVKFYNQIKSNFSLKLLMSATFLTPKKKRNLIRFLNLKIRCMELSSSLAVKLFL